jgi:hypothetical protein
MSIGKFPPKELFFGINILFIMYSFVFGTKLDFIVYYNEIVEQRRRMKFRFNEFSKNYKGITPYRILDCSGLLTESSKKYFLNNIDLTLKEHSKLLNISKKNLIKIFKQNDISPALFSKKSMFYLTKIERKQLGKSF